MSADYSSELIRQARQHIELRAELRLLRRALADTPSVPSMCLIEAWMKMHQNEEKLAAVRQRITELMEA